MTRVAQFILISIVGLALLTWVASDVVEATARAWFQRDIDSRARLVLTGATPAAGGCLERSSESANAVGRANARTNW